MTEILKKILLENRNIKKEHYKYIEVIENSIPEDCRENYYRNLKSIMIDTNAQDYEEKNLCEGGEYDPAENYLRIYKSHKDLLKQISLNNKNPEEVYERLYSQTFYHELLHVASSYYDPRMRIINSGFSRPDFDHPGSYLNVGLTEGFTEFLTIAQPDFLKSTSNYMVEMNFAAQILILVGGNYIKGVYFKNEGIDPIKVKLNKLTEDNYSDFLLAEIEANFLYNKKSNKNNTYLSAAQFALLDYLEKGIEKYIAENNCKRAKELYDVFSNFIIRPELLKKLGFNIKKYIGIHDCIARYNELNDKFFSKNNSKKSKILMK